MLLPSVLNASARVQQHIKQAQRQAHACRDPEHERADPVAVELCLPPVLPDECAHGVIKCPAGHERNEADDEVLLRRRFLYPREHLRPDRRHSAGHEGLQKDRFRRASCQQICTPADRAAQRCQRQQLPAHIEDQRKAGGAEQRRQKANKCLHPSHPQQPAGQRKAQRQRCRPQNRLDQAHHARNCIADENILDRVRKGQPRDQQHDISYHDLVLMYWKHAHHK